METKRLRTIQHPSHVQVLLETVISRAQLVPVDAYQIRDSDVVPSALRRIALEAAKEGRVWECWAFGGIHWLFTAELSLDASRERGTPVLRVSRYGDDGELMEAKCWMADHAGQWSWCSD
jgi:hypothetical protein